MSSAAQVLKAHLSPAVLKRHGEPDLLLELRTVDFPVHKTYIVATCGTLAELLRTFEGSDKLCLFRDTAETTAANVPDTVSSPADFESFLRVLYGENSSITDQKNAQTLLLLAEYYNCPTVCRAVDNYLALKASRYMSPDNVQGSQYLYPRISIPSLVVFLELASRHRLRRVMATCLPHVWLLAPEQRNAFFKEADPVVHAALVEGISERVVGGGDTRCSSTACESMYNSVLLTTQKQRDTATFSSWKSVCEKCCDRQEAAWRKAVTVYEQKLMERGFGH